ncbi:hypothetical protein [Modestobacter italicus]|uniref:hypothetical protein n=1 Tax=Modestobacter italicus (strain DSM 44449 / CECT 9708 / BC 501) TaxID=2732864 RepID=UPI001C969BED|nr:hypothetical protein [Modestobacter italicus]
MHELAARHPQAWALAVDLAFNAALLLVGEVVVQLSGWPRLWVFAGALVLGWSTRALVQHRRARRTADPGRPDRR